MAVKDTNTQRIRMLFEQFSTGEVSDYLMTSSPGITSTTTRFRIRFPEGK